MTGFEHCIEVRCAPILLDEGFDLYAISQQGLRSSFNGSGGGSGDLDKW